MQFRWPQAHPWRACRWHAEAISTVSRDCHADAEGIRSHTYFRKTLRMAELLLVNVEIALFQRMLLAMTT